MNTEAITDSYHSEYISLLNQLNIDNNSLDPLKISILCSQHKINLNEHIENNVCQYCLIPWRYGNFILKTITINYNKNNIHLQKIHPSFKMIMKCLTCLNLNSMVIKKKKLPRDKCTKAVSKSSTLIPETPKEIPQIKEKHKKKKRNQYAGLNPFVFKNNNHLLKNKTVIKK